MHSAARHRTSSSSFCRLNSLIDDMLADLSTGPCAVQSPAVARDNGRTQWQRRTITRTQLSQKQFTRFTRVLTIVQYPSRLKKKKKKKEEKEKKETQLRVQRVHAHEDHMPVGVVNI